MLKNISEHYNIWKKHPCAYCREEFSKTFIWINTPDCFHDDYFLHSFIQQEAIDKYYKNRESKRLKEQERKYKEEHMKEREKIFRLSDYEWFIRLNQIRDNSTIKCQDCGIKFEYDVLKSYFKAIFENIHMNSEHKNESFKLHCPHCKEEWPDEDVYVMFEDKDFLHSIHVFDKKTCCICQKRYDKVYHNDDKLNLDYIDNTCENCGANFCEDCLKKILQGQFYRCKCCNKRIINNFEDYHLCVCGEVIRNSELYCFACKKINVRTIISLDSDDENFDLKSLRSIKFLRRNKSRHFKRLKGKF